MCYTILDACPLFSTQYTICIYTLFSHAFLLRNTAKSWSDKNCEQYNEHADHHNDVVRGFACAMHMCSSVHYAADTRVVNFLRRDTLHRLIIACIVGTPVSKRAYLSA